MTHSVRTDVYLESSRTHL